MRKSRARRGMTFIEMVFSMFIVSIISLAAFPVAENSIRRAKEVELRRSLRLIRKAIDRHYEEQSRKFPQKSEADRYPKSLDTLVHERFLRDIPRDPFTGRRAWTTISFTDPRGPTVECFRSDGSNVFDVRSMADGAPPAGGPEYSRW